MMSLLVVVPLSFMTEGIALTPTNIEAAGGSMVLQNLVLAAFARCGDVLVMPSLSECVSHMVTN